jgi:glycosyltransferase involved in cell wall biosynthesis
LRRDPVDIVVTNTVVPLLGAVYAKLTRRPHIWSIKEHVDPHRRAARVYASLITRASAAVVVPSRVIGEAFSSRLHVLPDGGDVDDITSRAATAGRADVLRKLDLPVELPMVAQVGAISERKGQHVTAEAFVRLAAGGGPPTCSLVFFGHGRADEEQRVRRVLAGAPVEWQALVRFTAFEDGDLASLAAADIVVHPSTVHDAFPNAVREAMTLGKPVIASAMGGMVDMILDGDSGVLIAEGDSVALASAMDALVQSPVARRRLGASAAAFARQHFDVHQRKLALLQLFDQVVAS